MMVVRLQNLSSIAMFMSLALGYYQSILTPQNICQKSKAKIQEEKVERKRKKKIDGQSSVPQRA